MDDTITVNASTTNIDVNVNATYNNINVSVVDTPIVNNITVVQSPTATSSLYINENITNTDLTIVEAGCIWGSINGTLSAQTDLYNALQVHAFSGPYGLNTNTGAIYALLGNNTNTGNYSFIAGGNSNYTNLSNTFLLGSSLTALSADFTYVNNLNTTGIINAGSIIYTRGGNSSLWNTAYVLVSNGVVTTLGQIPSLSSNWNTAYALVSGGVAVNLGQIPSLSSNWNTAYALVSGGIATNLGQIPSLSSNWQNTYIAISALSSSWVTTPVLTNTLTGYLINNTFNNTLTAYAANTTVNILTSQLITNPVLTNTLSAYTSNTTASILTSQLVTSPVLTNTLTGYIISSTFNNTLTAYTQNATTNTLTSQLVTNPVLTNTLTAYTTNTTTNTLTSQLVTTPVLTNTLSSYTNNNTFSNTLTAYTSNTTTNILTAQLVTNPVLTNALTAYTSNTTTNSLTSQLITSPVLTNVLSGYLGNSAFSNTLTAYSTNTTVNTLTTQLVTTPVLTNTLTAYLPISGGTITGNLNITGTINLAGSATYINTANLVIGDSLIYLASGNPSNLNDIGIVGHFVGGLDNNTSGYQHTGLIRAGNQGSPGYWTFFSGVTTEPLTSNNITGLFSDPTSTTDSLNVYNLSAQNIIYDITGNSTQWNKGYNVSLNYQNTSGTFVTSPVLTNTLTAYTSNTTTNTLTAQLVTSPVLTNTLTSYPTNNVLTNSLSASSRWNVGGNMPIAFSANATLGGIAAGTPFSINTPLSAIIQRLLVAAVTYTYIAPTLTINTSANLSYEVGTNITPYITSLWTQNDGGSAIRYTYLTGYNGSTYNVLTSFNLTPTFYFNYLSATALAPFNILSSIYIETSANYLKGPQRQDNYGVDSGIPLSASSTTAFLTISAFRNIFYTSDTSTVPLSYSDSIRQLPNITPASTTGTLQTINLATANGSNSRIAFAYPDQYIVSQVTIPGVAGTLVNTPNANTIMNYLSTYFVSVSGANNLSPTRYRIFKMLTPPSTGTISFGATYSTNNPTNPNISAPSVSINTSTSTYTGNEAGAILSPTLTNTYTVNGGGTQTNVTFLSSGTSNTGPWTPIATQVPNSLVVNVSSGSTSGTTIYFTSSATYNAGVQQYTDYNDPYGTPVSAGGTALAGTAASVRTTSYFRGYFGTSTTATPTDTQIRTSTTGGNIILNALSNSRVLYTQASPVTVSLNASAPALYIFVAYPAYLDVGGGISSRFVVNSNPTTFNSYTISSFTNQYGVSIPYVVYVSPFSYVDASGQGFSVYWS
jgi:hypothetical protein